MSDYETRQRRPLAGEIDFTVMYAAHDAFSRDLVHLAAAVADEGSSGRGSTGGHTGDGAVRAGWTTFRRQLHVHHTAEDVSLWPLLRERVTASEDVAVLDLMEAEHAQLDPLLDRTEALLLNPGLLNPGLLNPGLLNPGLLNPGRELADTAYALVKGLAAHMEHEEEQALPLIAAHLSVREWAAFGRTSAKIGGVRGLTEFLPWLLDGVPDHDAVRVLGALPPPVRLLYRYVSRRRYARTARWTEPGRLS
jgi:iron-sulfur cluster repair protein YtfE (RIC family)